MAARSRIEWTQVTWNPVTGCSKVSAGCKHCYAERFAERLRAMGIERYRNGFRVTLHYDLLDLPKHWKSPRIVFVNSMSDLFHELVPFDFIQRVFTTMRDCPQHTFQILTKRSRRLRELAPELEWSPNIWIGVSVENASVLYRIEDLRHVPAAVRFLSCEPLLGPLDNLPLEGIHWVIVGGESGPGARSMRVEWVRSIRDQCKSQGVAFFFKQWGGVRKHRSGRLLDGSIYDEMPNTGRDAVGIAGAIGIECQCPRREQRTCAAKFLPTTATSCVSSSLVADDHLRESVDSALSEGKAALAGAAGAALDTMEERIWLSSQIMHHDAIFARMIVRSLHKRVVQALKESPAVCLFSPQQAGKTTLALAVARERPAVYLDLKSPQDRAKLQDAEAYLALHRDRLVILDEVHRMPELLPILRGLIDRGRREGQTVGRYLLLGSASLGLLRHVGESLAGRARALELNPFSLLEPHGRPPDMLWLRGGFPESLLAADDERSFRWRQDFIRAYVEREVPQLFPTRLPAETLRRLWTLLAHLQGSPLNLAELARSLGIDVRTVGRYLDLLTDLFLLRQLRPWHANVGKRLVKSPRLYLRDSGIVHALLSIRSLEDLLSHPVSGASWEGWVLENIAGCAPEGTELFYYRTSAGAETDLLLLLPRGERWAVEIKRSLAPHPARGFYLACEDVRADRRFLVYPGQASYPIQGGVKVVGIEEFCRITVQEGERR